MLPGKTVEICLPIENLMTLPEGAAYSQGEGNLKVNAKRKGNALVIDASQDSIRQVVEYYEREESDVVQNTSASTQETAVNERHPNGVRIPIEWAAAGMIFGIVLLLFILKKARQWKKAF